jgi:hypothetical protein
MTGCCVQASVPWGSITREEFVDQLATVSFSATLLRGILKCALLLDFALSSAKYILRRFIHSLTIL